jgi:hypothetical protein
MSHEPQFRKSRISQRVGLRGEHWPLVGRLTRCVELDVLAPSCHGRLTATRHLSLATVKTPLNLRNIETTTASRRAIVRVSVFLVLLI